MAKKQHKVHGSKGAQRIAGYKELEEKPASRKKSHSRKRSAGK